LLKQRRTDENGNLVNTFTDQFGNTVATIVDSAGLNHKTTFQYDVLGNLLKSKAPKGDSTKYFYNTLNQLRQKISPDAGATEYLYDQNGNLRFVKDANGAAGSYFIYYKYDAFNRKIEEGKVNSLAPFRQDSANISSFPATGYTWKTKYHYDAAGYTASAPQRNLRGRLDGIEYVTDRYPNVKGFIFYSYDNNGNLEWIDQLIPKSNVSDGNGYLVVKIEYQYDSLGKVTKTYFHRTFPPGGASDAFYTWYDYDALGRLEKVFTNTADLKPALANAQYTYWPGGQVKRLVLSDTLQGLDYLYNSRDWLTQINHQNLNYTEDPGGDGGGAGVPIADRFGQVLGYDKQKGIANGHSDFFAQYNGNISWTYHKTLGNTQPVSSGIVGWVFRYDKANRLVKGNWGHWQNGSPGSWQLSRRYDVTGRTAPDSLIEYDANGNIDYMIRFDQNNAATLMDYSYLANSNKLNFINGLSGQGSGNYVYDANGNMIKDVVKLGSSNTISYDYRNLPYKIPTASGTIDFGYDAKGQRVSKNNVFYVPDASGRTIAVYDDKGTLLYWNIWGLDLVGQRFWKQ
jgi:YD repeat-containing protein